MNIEAIAYYNPIGQFYYFARSQKVAGFINDCEEYIPNILRIKIFRMKQSAHRATDVPRGENAYNMAQLDRLFTSQFVLINSELRYQVMLEEVDPSTGAKAINFQILKDHPKVLREVNHFIELISNN